jgi:hypothetical protein
MGGTIGQARYMSRFLALQIKADVEGVPFQPYTKTPGEPEREEWDERVEGGVEDDKVTLLAGLM